MRIKNYKHFVAMITAISLIIGMVVPGFALSMSAENNSEATPVSVDISASKWVANSRVISFTDSENGTQMNVGDDDDCWLANGYLSTPVDLSKEFSITFSLDNYANHGRFAFRLSKTAEFVNWNDGSCYDAGGFNLGGTYYTEGYLQSYGGAFRQCGATGDFTFTVTKGLDAWVVSMSRGGVIFETMIVPFTSFAEDFFTKNKAYLYIYNLNVGDDGAYHDGQITINNVTNCVESIDLATNVKVDISASKWVANSRVISFADSENGTQMNVGDDDDCWLANGYLSTPVDLSQEFSLTFSLDEYANQGRFAFRLSKTAEFVNWNDGSCYDAGGFNLGGTYYTEGYLQSYGGAFRNCGATGDFTFTVTKGLDAWVISMSRGGVAFEKMTIPFTSFAEDFFTKNKAYLHIYNLNMGDDGAYHDGQITIKEITHYVSGGDSEETGPELKDVTIDADSWKTNNTSITIAGADNGTQIKVSDSSDCHCAGALLKTPISVEDEVTIKFSIDEYIANDGRWGFRLTKSNATAGWSEQKYDTNGITIGGIWYQSGYFTPYQGSFTPIPDSGDITLKIVPDTASWKITFARGDKSFLMNEVSYDAIPRDFFKNNKAYLSLFFLNGYGGAYENGQFTIKGITHYVSESSGDDTGDVEEEGFNLMNYTTPYWEGNTIYNEAVTPIANPDGTIDDVELLYDATMIRSVRDSMLSVTYEEGVDYELVDGKLRILPDGNIPIIPYSEYFPDEGWALTDGKHIVHTEGPMWVAKQLAVTYNHLPDKWNGYVPTAKGYLLPNTISKLANKENLKIVMYGDSISAGGNVSGALGLSPWMPSFAGLIVDRMKEDYGYDDIDIVNTSVGGTNIEWGIENADERVIAHSPDIVMLHFGTNNSHDPDYFASLVSQFIDKIKASLPNVEVVLISNPLPLANDTVMYGDEYFARLREYEYSMLKLEGQGVAVARATSVYEYIRAQKSYWDITANCVNHPNDFIHRAIAMTVLATVKAGGSAKDAEFTKNYYVLPESEKYEVPYGQFNGKKLVMDGGAMLYTGSRLYNDMAVYRMSIRELALNDWIGLSTRVQIRVADWCYNQDCYAFLIQGDNGIRLRRMGANPEDLLILYDENFTQYRDGNQWTIAVGTFDVENGVRVVLEINGKVIIDYTDTSEFALTKHGWSGVSLLNSAKVTLEVGTVREDDDKDVPNYRPEPANKYSYVGYGFDHALDILVNNKNIIPDATLVGAEKEDIKEEEKDPDADKMLNTFSAVNQINSGKKDAVIKFDITNTPIIDTPVWETAKKPENAEKTLIFEHFDKNNEIDYIIEIKCKDIKSIARTNLLITGGVSGDKPEFANDNKPFVVTASSPYFPGKMKISYLISNDWKDSLESDKLHLSTYSNNKVNELADDLVINADGYVSFEISSTGAYYLSDTKLELKKAEADNSGNNDQQKPSGDNAGNNTTDTDKDNNLNDGAENNGQTNEPDNDGNNEQQKPSGDNAGNNTTDTDKDNNLNDGAENNGQTNEPDNDGNNGGNQSNTSDEEQNVGANNEEEQNSNLLVAAIIMISAAVVAAVTILLCAVVVKKKRQA